MQEKQGNPRLRSDTVRPPKFGAGYASGMVACSSAHKLLVVLSACQTLLKLCCEQVPEPHLNHSSMQSPNPGLGAMIRPLCRRSKSPSPVYH